MKCRSLYYSHLIVLLSIWFTSCNGDNEELTFPVSKDAVTILPDITVLMNLWLGGEPPFTVVSEDTEIATVACQDNGILLITGKNFGETKLTVRDKNNAKAVIAVNVGRGGYGYGSFSFNVTGYQFNVEASDVAVRESIESEIRNNLPVPIKGGYYMDFSIPCHLLVSLSGKNTDYLLGYFKIKEGRYEFLYGEHLADKYQYQIVGGSEFNELILIEDLTKAYQEKYPDAGIVKVYREQYAEIE
ncbi:MAG: pilus assembly protein N-terminal domain-containing protein [Tannerellaceae bacterium]|jgi:hypothetical protein|nr:pilus assembly protein N-terminal domain-containing protein [Tannerellaceae bacterium]